MTFTKTLIDTLTNRYGLSIYTSYSGKFMYGTSCFGIVCDNLAGLHKFYKAMYELKSEPNVEPCVLEFWNSTDVKAVCSDNMGLGIIVYFPGIVCESTELEVTY